MARRPIGQRRNREKLGEGRGGGPATGILMKGGAALAGLTLLSFLLVGITRRQEQDAEGSKEHPLFSRMPNSYIRDDEEKEFARYEFQVGADETAGVEGRYCHITYNLREESKVPSQLHIIPNYENAIKKIGGRVLWDNGDSQATLKLARHGKEIWASVLAAYGGKLSHHLTIVEKEAMMQEGCVFSASDPYPHHISLGFLTAAGKFRLGPHLKQLRFG